MHCLTSDTSGPAHVSLNSAEVIFGMRDSDGCMRRFGQHAFIHADLPFALFPLSALGALFVCYISIMKLDCSMVPWSCLFL